MIESSDQLYILWVNNPGASEIDYHDMIEDFCADMETTELKVYLLKAVDVKAAAHVTVEKTSESKLAYDNLSAAISAYISNLP